MRHLLYISLCFVSLAAAQTSRDSAWRQDLDQLATQLPKLHPNLFYYSPRATFDSAVEALRNDIPSLSDGDVLVRMAAIVALAHDAHTSLSLSQRPAWFRMLPLKFQWFEDGLFVIGTTAEYARAAGSKVLRIGDRTAAEAYEAVKRVISHENDNWVRENSPAQLANADVLRALGVVAASDSVRFELQGRDGAVFTLDVASLERGQSPTIVLYPNPADGYLPAYRQNLNRAYWFQYIESSRTLYFAYNACREMADLPFAQFNDQLWAAFDSLPVERIVIDVRNNQGGNSAVIQPFLQSGFARAARLESVRAELIVGRATFSSGTLAAVALHQGPVVSYGEASGGSPNGYGELGRMTLPAFGTVVGYSTKLISAQGAGPGPVLPDVPVPIYSADYFGRHDPFLAAAMADAARPLTGGTIAVVNAASFRGPVAPGSLASAFGDWGEGAGVTVDGAAARVIATFPGQVDFQVPEGTRTGIVAARIGQVDGTVRVVDAAPGLFAAIARDGYAEIYGTGQGSGSAPKVYIGGELAETLYSGAHPAFPGLWQVNARVRAGGTGEVPVYVTLGGMASNAVTLRMGN